MTPSLLSLRLRDHHWINEDTISKIGYFAINLRELSLEGLQIHDDTLIEIVNSAQHLNKINVSSCSLLTSRSIDLLMEKKFDKLEGLGASKMEDKFSEQSKGYLARLKGLHYLDLSLNPTLLSTEVLEGLAQGSQRLRELDLAGCKDLEEKAVAQIVSTSKHFLVSVDLSHCTYKGGDGSSIWQAMHGAGPTLTHLRLCDSEDVSDTTLSTLFHKSSPLVSYFDKINRLWRREHQQRCAVCRHFKLSKCQ
jgi:hypothetical protein